MKLFSVFMLSVLLLTAAQAQTIRRVNNNPGVTGVNVYSTPQAAHDAAAANDILLIEPSETSYGTLIVTKPLKIYGNGYFLDINTELRADDRSSRFTTIEFNIGSTGSVVSGIECSSLYLYAVSSINVERCAADNVHIYTRNSANTMDANVSDIVIRNNFIWYLSASPGHGFTISNVIVTNNIIKAPSNTGVVFDASYIDIQNWIVRNNYISQFNGDIRLSNSVFENNVCDKLQEMIFSNVSYSYNVSSGNHFVGGVGNQNNFDFSNEFLGTGSDDEKLMLKASSVLKTAASDGGEIGPFGGTTPYVISGIPPIPSITEMFNTGTGSNDTPLQVNISVKSND